MVRKAFALFLLGTAFAQTQDPWIVYQKPASQPQPTPPAMQSSPPTSSENTAFPGLNPTEPGFSPGFTPPTQTSLAVESPYKPGEIRRGRMLTGAYLIPGKSVPVAVELEDKTVLVGTARFDPTGRVWIDFSTAVKRGQVYTVSAVALEATEWTQGLPAKVGDEAPTLVADLVRGALGGISDFVKASLEATNVVTLPGGGQAVEKKVPGLEMFLLARAADLVALPKESTAVLRTVKVERDTPVLVFFLPGPQQNPGEAPASTPGR
ncbi:conserved hypothetical protein [Thermus scotoductus SA-01]|uniref:Uncharacterized protein n=3 Tax=Thermus scotoductus TaxID=37636 RepID=E8PL30_THESS|nr:conserved hypothetical protein [Thermus scotoductus SA-01]